jgi:hypothetical protein
MNVMRSFVAASMLLVVGATAGIAGQQGPAGEWRVQFATPLGQHVATMTLNQSGAKLTGHVTDEYGEYPLVGQFADKQVTAIWSVYDDGKMLEITLKGTLEGNVINGVAKLGDAGEGPLVARRIGEADAVSRR